MAMSLSVCYRSSVGKISSLDKERRSMGWVKGRFAIRRGKQQVEARENELGMKREGRLGALTPYHLEARPRA